MTVPGPVDVGERRRRLLEAAAHVLVQDGPHGLSLRRVATLAGGSTQMVYTLFGGKPGLADALYEEGFQRLARSMSEAAVAPPGDPERLVGLGRGYRRFALDEPALYSVMFGPVIPGFTARPETRRASRERSFGQVVVAVQECLDAGTMTGGGAEELARQCWVGTHGLVSLEIAGLLGGGDREAFAEQALQLPVDAHRTVRDQTDRTRPGRPGLPRGWDDAHDPP